MDQYGNFHHRETNQEPASVTEAKIELAELSRQIGKINKAFEGARDRFALQGKSEQEYRDWVTNAHYARKKLGERQRWLKNWVNIAPREPKLPNPTGGLIGTTAAARQILKRIGLLESVFVAAGTFLRYETPEALAELKARYVYANGPAEGTEDDDAS